jgi:hypothetical protein
MSRGQFLLGAFEVHKLALDLDIDGAKMGASQIIHTQEDDSAQRLPLSPLSPSAIGSR